MASITQQKIGSINGKDVVEFTLQNKHKAKATILNYGGTITAIYVPDSKGDFENVTLGFANLDGYLQQGNPFFGCLVGRYANRIANAAFSLNGKTYTLAANNNGNTLHGGAVGFDKKIWESSVKGEELQLVYISEDGEEGYPGTLTVTVTYSFDDANSLVIDYKATTTAPTHINLTNHVYFNLSAGKQPTILHHELQLLAEAYTPVNDKLIPTGKLAPVANTAFDFNTTKAVGKDIAATGAGYDHNFVLNNNGKLKAFATLTDPESRRQMVAATTQPGVQLYTGNFLNSTMPNTYNGLSYGKHAGLCLETQHFPDSPNQPSFPSTLLKPGDVFHQVTSYTFSTL